MSQNGRFKIAGETYDLDDLELDEVEELEDLYGKLIGRGEGVPFSLIPFGSSKGMKALAFVLQKQKKPDITLEECGKMKLLQFEEPDEEAPASPPAIPTPSPSESEDVVSGPPASVASIRG